MDLDAIAALEQSWMNRVQITEPETYFDWAPFAPAQFADLLQQCLSHVPVNTFLDAGCGIGTKCLIAADAGLVASGFDRVPEYVAEASQLGVDVLESLAEEFTDYGAYGLVYVNHPLKTSDEASLENMIQEAMASGAVLLSVNYDLAPGCPVHPPTQPCTDVCPVEAGWPEVARDGRWNAAWVKP